MDWFKTKKPAQTADSSDHLLGFVRTMQDDLDGRAVLTERSAPPEPLVAFRPDTTAGAPFFVAPGAKADVETVASDDLIPSPFLQTDSPVSAGTASEENTPTFDPPLPTQTVSEDAVSAAQEKTSIPLTLNTIPEPTSPSLRARLASLPKSLGQIRPLFQDRKIRAVTLIAAILLFLVLVAGLYLGWRSFSGDQTAKNLPPSVVIESPEKPETMPEVLPVVQTKYVAEQPNILSFDTETVTAEQIKDTLLQAGQALKKDNLSGAIEFLVRDQKLNPLALSRFVYLAKLPFSTELLSTLDEPFSLYITIDDGRPRIALLTYIKDEPAFTAELRRSEKNLAQILDPLFLDVTTAPKGNLTFRDGLYLDRPVRFANVDTTLGLSVDYAVRGRQWVLATSKNALRSVLDKTGL